MKRLLILLLLLTCVLATKPMLEGDMAVIDAIAQVESSPGTFYEWPVPALFEEGGILNPTRMAEQRNVTAVHFCTQAMGDKCPEEYLFTDDLFEAEGSSLIAKQSVTAYLRAYNDGGEIYIGFKPPPNGSTPQEPTMLLAGLVSIMGIVVAILSFRKKSKWIMIIGLVIFLIGLAAFSSALFTMVTEMGIAI